MSFFDGLTGVLNYCKQIVLKWIMWILTTHKCIQEPGLHTGNCGSKGRKRK